MFPGEFPEFSIDDLIEFNSNTLYGDNFSFDGSNWHLPNASQLYPYTGAGVQGDLNSYPDFQTPTTAPTPSYQTPGMSSKEGKSSCTSQLPSFRAHSLSTGHHFPSYEGVAMPSFPSQPVTTTPPFTAVPPAPTLSCDRKCPPVAVRTSLTHLLWLASPLPPAQISPAYRPYAQPQVAPNPGDLGLGFHTTPGSSSLPMAHPPLAYNPSYNGCESSHLHLSNPARMLTIHDSLAPVLPTRLPLLRCTLL